STRVVQQRIYTDIEEDTVYLQLLLITVASLVLVVFVVSIIFSCWWIKSRQENLEPVPCYVDASEKPEYAEDCRLDGNDTANTDGEIELISLGQNIFNSYENDTAKSKLTGGEYTTFTALSSSKENAEEKGNESDMDGAKPLTEANATLPGTTHTLPRYTIAGNNGTGGSSAAVIGIPPSIISSTVASTANTFGASLPRMSCVDRVGMTGLKMGHSSTTGRTRHVAKEFLDESVLNTAARKLKGSNEQAMRRPPLSNIVSTAATSSTAPQQVILLPAASTGTAGGEQAFLLASTAGQLLDLLHGAGGMTWCKQLVLMKRVRSMKQIDGGQSSGAALVIVVLLSPWDSITLALRTSFQLDFKASMLEVQLVGVVVELSVKKLDSQSQTCQCCITAMGEHGSLGVFVQAG
ncbi:hypothetical protein TSMEX_005703, partial [Taenia solium]